LSSSTSCPSYGILREDPLTPLLLEGVIQRHLLHLLQLAIHLYALSFSSDKVRADVQTLATLLDEGKKRKRSITHFEGIPLSLIRPEVKAPVDRRVATSRRMRELERTMARLCCDRSEDMVCHFPSTAFNADDRPIQKAKAKTKATMTTL
jgi:hypothetical protein